MKLAIAEQEEEDRDDFKEVAECLEEIVTAACKGQTRFPRHLRVVQAHGPIRKAIAEEDEEQDFEAETKKAELQR